MKANRLAGRHLDACVKRWRLQGFKLTACARMAKITKYEAAVILHRQRLLSKKHLDAIRRQSKENE